LNEFFFVNCRTNNLNMIESKMTEFFFVNCRTNYLNIIESNMTDLFFNCETSVCYVLITVVN
jgi:hypothetical protein